MISSGLFETVKAATREGLPAMFRMLALSVCLGLWLSTLAAVTPGAADGTDPQALRPLLLPPARSTPDAGERHRATVYRSGLTRDIRQLERARTPKPSSSGTGRETHGRLGAQSKLNARRGELSRIDRSLGRRSR